MTGLIYMMVCNITGKSYIGSTKRSLNRRMNEHKSHYKSWMEGKCDFITSFKIIEQGDYCYRILETVESDSKQQIEARERYYIENTDCVNEVIPHRTKKEYDDDNKEKKKAYCEANKEAIKARKRAYYLRHKQIKE